MRLAPATALIAALIVLHGCVSPFGPYCGTVYRSTAAQALFSPAGVRRIERMDVTLSQGRSNQAAGSLRWTLVGVDLEYHVTGLRLVLAASPDSVLLELPIESIQPAQMAGTVDIRFPDPDGVNRLYDLLLRSQAAAEVVTDIPGRERIDQTLLAAAGGGWVRTTCGD